MSKISIVLTFTFLLGAVSEANARTPLRRCGPIKRTTHKNLRVRVRLSLSRTWLTVKPDKPTKPVTPHVKPTTKVTAQSVTMAGATSGGRVADEQLQGRSRWQAWRPDRHQRRQYGLTRVRRLFQSVG